MTRRPLTARRAQTLIDAAELVKASDWRETRRWHVVADGQILVVIAPSYGGISRSGRNGWRWWIADLGPTGDRDRRATRQGAAAAGLAQWKRWITSKT